MSKPTQTNKINVLVVDDDHVCLEALTAILEETGIIECIATFSSTEAIELYQSNDIHITFLDINMPAPDGIETLKQIKEINNKAKVVMVTANSDIATVKKAIGLGASSYIVKPYQTEKIFAAIKTLAAQLSEQ